MLTVPLLAPLLHHSLNTCALQRVHVLALTSQEERRKVEFEETLFEALLQTEGVHSAVSLDAAVSDKGRGLVAKRSVEAGESLLVIPEALLLTAHRSGIVGGLVGQTDLMFDAAGDLREEVGAERFSQGQTWDVRLALAVFEATAGGCGGSFWDQYRRLLPLPPFLATSLCLPAPLLAQLHDPVLEKISESKKALLSRSFPALGDHIVHPATAVYLQAGAPAQTIPLPLFWAYALVVSRCFAMSDGDTFAFVPFLDMAQHAEKPSANFASTAEGFELTALRPLHKGEDVTISYDRDEYNSRRMFELYGFAPELGTARDAELLAEALVLYSEIGAPVDSVAPRKISTADIQPLLAAFDAHKGSEYSSKPRLAAIYDALTADEAPDVARMLESVRWQRGEWATSLAEDLHEQQEMLQQTSGGGMGARATAVLSYRISRKKQFVLAEEVLSTFLDA
eukprot:CAMPEP_0119304428 /NCGR_PEP_ID=MMETSP1333-20130426/5649_1 /TAXON_ID=418940 /ORGANISM="Scyphosphaera apsteinii, Strain RCC1455" /LENGTH=452 /DNA_ID=CAMNT_0007307309 /DNA_START=30 /DNA_END=1388 /DNA_ORIENTATION=-